MLKGIDVSNWESELNLANIQGIDFAIFKATEGLKFKDWTLEQFVKQATRKKILWGCYHFARNNVPQQEAEFFYRKVKQYVGKCIFVLDIEDMTIKNPAKYCYKFCNRFYELSGVRPLIYTYHYYRSRFNGYDSIYRDYDLWLAGYPKSYTSWTRDACPYNSGKWPYIAMWQFTEKGRLKGYSGNLDLNYAYMTKAAWKRYAQSIPKK